MKKTLWVLCATFALSTFPAWAAGDLTPEMVKETARRIEAKYLVRLPYLEKALEKVPVKKASNGELSKNGSTEGIYDQKTLYLNEALFDSGGLVVDGAGLGIIAHEGWHAYYDQVMPADARKNLERIWIQNYSREKINTRDAAIWIGDEAVGNYAQGLASIYVAAVEHYLKKPSLGSRLLKTYKECFSGADIFGYYSSLDANGNDLPVRMSNLPISEAEIAVYSKVSENAFPAPADLLKTLAARVEAAAQKK